MTIIEAWARLDKINTALELKKYSVNLQCDLVGLECSNEDFVELMLAVFDKIDGLEAEEKGEFTRPTEDDIAEALDDFTYEKNRDEVLF